MVLWILGEREEWGSLSRFSDPCVHSTQTRGPVKEVDTWMNKNAGPRTALMVKTKRRIHQEVHTQEVWKDLVIRRDLGLYADLSFT